MAVFDMMTWASTEHWRQADEISEQYFTVDTATMDSITEWIEYNRLIVTYATHNNQVQGFTNLMPLTREAALLFERNEIREEDLTPEHILSPDVMHYAEYLYLPAIAVKNYQSYTAMQCAAALMSSLAYTMLNFYDPKRLKRIFVNPTTFQGNRMTLKLGLEKLAYHKKMLTGNDMYYADFNEDTIQRLQNIQQRYDRFIGYHCWKEKDWTEKLAARSATR